MSSAWSNFESDFLNANSWPQRKDGFPEYLLDALSPQEKVQAAIILKERLDGRDDWPIRAMAHLKIRESIPLLESLLKTVDFPTTRAVIATVLYELTGDTSFEDEVVSVATAKKDWVYRLDAIHCLARFETESARKVLNDLTSDEDYLVSYNAKLAGRTYK